MIIQACLCPSLWNKRNDDFWWVYKSLERNRTKSKKKIGNIFFHVTIGTNVTKGVSMIIQAFCCPHYGTRVTMVLGRCINHWNKTNEKVKKTGDIFSQGTNGTNVTKGV